MKQTESKILDFFRVGGGSFQALSDNTKTFIETDTETFLRPRVRLFRLTIKKIGWSRY